MAFRTPFSEIKISDDDGCTVRACFKGDWFLLKAVQGIDIIKVIKVARALDAGNDPQNMLESNITAVMDALDAPLTETSTFTVEINGTDSVLELPCPPLVVENIEAKMEATTNAFRGIIQLAKTIGVSSEELTKAFMLVEHAPDAESSNMMGPMAAMGAQQCTQQ